MKIQNRFFIISIPAGEYYLGDPCYAVKDEHWDSLLDQTHYFDNPVGHIDKNFILGFSTQYGDGVYQDQYGNEYPVDAGLIGLVPKEYVDKYRAERQFLEGMHLVKFDTEFICKNTERGVLVFGHYEIDTN